MAGASAHAEDALAFTEAPSTLSALWRQRYRWSYGTMQAVWKHRRALGEGGETRIGLFGIPYCCSSRSCFPCWRR